LTTKSLKCTKQGSERMSSLHELYWRH